MAKIKVRKTGNQQAETEKKKSTFASSVEWLGVNLEGQTGDNHYGECMFCGSPNKFYINEKSGMWDCKKCGESGNIITFLNKFYETNKKSYPLRGRIDKLAKHRGLPNYVLMEAKLFSDGESWFLPIFSTTGSVMSLRRYKMEALPKNRMRNMPHMDLFLWGVETITKKTKKVIICEGEWDCLAMRDALNNSHEAEAYQRGEIAVIAVPGAGVWKKDWNQFVEGKQLLLCFDADKAGRDGRKRLFELLGGQKRKEKVEWVEWPDDIHPGFDFREFYLTLDDKSQAWNLLQELVKKASNSTVTQTSSGESHKPKVHVSTDLDFPDILTMLSKWLRMTPEHQNVAKIAYACFNALKIPGDPLWMQIVGAPGSGKTEILMTTEYSENVLLASNVTPAGLISGFPSREDPSLIPKAMDKVFMMKDFTEVLQMNKVARQEIFAILRGAYDGSACRSWGNGQTREYKGTFGFLTGVTHAIDMETDNSMGERFLKYRMLSQSEMDSEDIIMQALSNVGRDAVMREELHTNIKEWLDRDMKFEDVPEPPMETTRKIMKLSMIVTTLRTSVERDPRTRERILYRPSRELGTRAAKQMKKLLMALAMNYRDMQYREEDYQLVARVALDSCIPFYLEVVRALLRKPSRTVEEVSKEINLPMTSCREVFDDLLFQKVLSRTQTEKAVGPGRRSYLWSVTDKVIGYWEDAGLG